MRSLPELADLSCCCVTLMYTLRDNGGWMDIVGILDKVFPTFCDNRASPCTNTEWQQYYEMANINRLTFIRDTAGDCVQMIDASCTEYGTELLPRCCPRGQLFWCSFTTFLPSF